MTGDIATYTQRISLAKVKKCPPLSVRNTHLTEILRFYYKMRQWLSQINI